MASNDLNTQSGVGTELQRFGKAQWKYIHRGVRGEVHPCVAAIHRESKTAIVVQYVSPDGTPFAAAGQQLRFCVPICSGYLLSAGISMRVTRVTTLQADSYVDADTLCYKDDAGFMLINECIMVSNFTSLGWLKPPSLRSITNLSRFAQ